MNQHFRSNGHSFEFPATIDKKGLSTKHCCHILTSQGAQAHGQAQDQLLIKFINDISLLVVHQYFNEYHRGTCLRNYRAWKLKMHFFCYRAHTLANLLSIDKHKIKLGE